MLLKGALEPVDQLSLVTGCWRPVIDLLALNGYFMLTKFKMETVASVLGSIRRGDWMFLLDLKDTYFQIPVHLESQPYLRFFSKDVFTSSMPCVSACPQPCRCSPESSP